MEDEKWITEFLRNLKITRERLRKQHGDRMIDGRTADDFAQDAAIAIWRNNADPKFMQRKANLQQKTFFTRRFYRKPKSVHVSNMERSDLDGDAAAHVFVSREGQPPFEPTEEDWTMLKRRFNLRQIDIEMLQMRTRGISAREIAKVVGITPNSVHVRISDIKTMIVSFYKSDGRPE